MKYMKYTKLALIIIGVIILLNSHSVLAGSTTKAILFYGDGCPHCGKVEQYIQEHSLDEQIIKKEIYHNSQNAVEFNKICDKENINLVSRGVPLLYINNSCLVGDRQIINYFDNKDKNVEPNKGQKNNVLTIPVVIGAALVDAVNPCAFAVLLILMMTILAGGKRKKALYSGLAFSFSIFISYFLMGIGLYSIVVSFAVSQVFSKIIGIIAIILALLNLKDYFWYGKGFLMEVPLSWRPRMKKLITGVTSPIGAFLIGFLVSLFLLPCTSGPYIVIIGMLGQQATHNLAIKLLLLYNLIFVLPMVIISFATYFGLNVQKAEEKRKNNLRWLHLIAGIIMLVMGIYLLIM